MIAPLAHSQKIGKKVTGQKYVREKKIKNKKTKKRPCAKWNWHTCHCRKKRKIFSELSDITIAEERKALVTGKLQTTIVAVLHCAPMVHHCELRCLGHACSGPLKPVSPPPPFFSVDLHRNFQENKASFAM